MTTRALTVAVRVDADTMDPGIQAALVKERAFCSQVEKDSAKVASAANPSNAAASSAARFAAEDAQKRKEIQLQMDKVHELQAQGNMPAAKNAQYKAIRMETDRLDRKGVADSIMRMEQEAASAAAASAKKVAIAAQESQQRSALEDRLYALTHSKRDVDIVHLQRYYGQQKMLAAGNAQQLALIDKTYRAELAALDGGDTGGGFNSRKWLGRHGAGGFLRHGLSAAGMSGVGGELASPLMMMGYMGAAAGGAMAGVMLVANAYRDAQENAKKLVEIEQSYSKAIRDANKALADRAPLTARGQRSQQAFDILQAEIDKQRDIAHAADKEIKSYGGWFHPIEGITGMLGGTTQLDVRLEAMKKTADLQAQQVKRAREIEASEKEEAWRGKIRAGYALDEVKAAGMKEGSDKRRFELEVRQSKELFEIRMHMRDHPLAGDLEAPAQKRFTLERKNLEDQIAREAGEGRVEAAAKYEDAVIRSWARGVERERELLMAKYRREREDAINHDRDLESVEKRHAADMLDLATKQAEASLQNKKAMHTMEDQVTVLHGKMTVREAEERRLKRESPDMSEQQRKDMVNARIALDTAQKAKTIRDEQHPINKWKEYRDEIQNMVKTGELSEKEGSTALQQRMAQMIGKRPGGQFMDAVSYAQSVQTAVLANDLNHPLTAKDIKQMQDDIATTNRLLNAGIKVVLAKG